MTNLHAIIRDGDAALAADDYPTAAGKFAEATRLLLAEREDDYRETVAERRDVPAMSAYEAFGDDMDYR